MINKNIKLVTLFLCIILVISACSTTDSLNYKEKTTIEDALQYLTSDQCNGRLVGTKGNRLAQDYIVKKFKEYGLKPYNGTYYHSYPQTLVNINDVKFELILPNNVIRRFKNGKDYKVNFFNKIDLKLPIYTENINGEDCIILAKKYDVIKKLNQESNIKGFILLNETFCNQVLTERAQNEKIILDVTKEVYDILKDSTGQQVSISMDYEKKVIEENNIIGVIPGKVRDEAILITAHLDHVGGIGDRVWRGAVDNASGISVLLDILKRLSEYANTNQLNKDLIFCAINGEEAGLVGSHNLALLLNDDYIKIENINLDCVGQKGKDKVMIDSKGTIESNSIANKIKEFIEDKGMKAEITTKEFCSDHISFENAVNISTGADINVIHTTIDNLDKLDIVYMNKISKILSEFLIKYLSSEIEKNESELYYDRIRKELDEERNKLNFGEYKFVEINGENYCVRKSSFKGNKEEVSKIYNNDLDFIPEEIAGIKLEGIFITDYRCAFKIPDIDEHVVGKVYKDKILASNINNVEIIYYDENKNLPFISILIETFFKDDKNEMDTYNNIWNNIDCDSKIKTENYMFFLKRGEDKKKEKHIDALYVKQEDKNKVYLTRVESRFIDECKNDEEIIRFIKNNNIEGIIKGLIDWLQEK
ncbi:M28 family metallopeptidase [Caloranaerobacter sp. DY30410]|uniref:M28 family metallopeptidase n=1 Tax=Caloranaerobacter sp. DY30410 TaxID=3238305 RepID=UPI003D01653C